MDTRRLVAPVALLSLCLMGQDYNIGFRPRTAAVVTACDVGAGDVTWCLSFEEDSTSGTCDAEDGDPNQNLPGGETGTHDCDSTASAAGIPAGSEVLDVGPDTVAIVAGEWDNEVSDTPTEWWVNFCFQAETNGTASATILDFRSNGAPARAGFKAELIYNPNVQRLKFHVFLGSCQTANNVITEDRWTSITIHFDETNDDADVYVNDPVLGTTSCSENGTGAATNIDGLALVWDGSVESAQRYFIDRVAWYESAPSPITPVCE